MSGYIDKYEIDYEDAPSPIWFLLIFIIIIPLIWTIEKIQDTKSKFMI
jgi:hypothetical protein